MDYSVKSGNPEQQRTGCLVLGVYEFRRLTPAAEKFDAACNGYLATLLSRADIEGKPGQTLLLVEPPAAAECERVLLVGCGQPSELDERRYREVLAKTALTLNDTGAAEALSYLAELDVEGRDLHWKLRQAVEVTEEALYRFDEFKSKPEESRRSFETIGFGLPEGQEPAAGERAVREGLAIAAGVRLARDLGNRPGNVCTPSHLAEQAQALARESDSIRVQVLENADMETLGMGSLLSVAKGSEQPPKLIVLEYRNGSEGQKPVVLVGKGVTFDTGGISLKPGAEMDEMKFDMCGAASVLGAFKACARLELPLDVIGIIPAVENMPGGRASKPGDIVTSLSGQTIEILNTDAEGRLILCDALTYSERFEPDAVIDVATLTGACVIALGRHAHGLMSNHPPLARALLEAGRTAHDRAWELPLWDEYQKQLDSNFADMANIGGREGGSITAACFLARYTKKLHWAHLDIAGTAWKSGKEKGATGRPVPLLTQYLLDRAAQG